jgi:hypothetical protein
MFTRRLRRSRFGAVRVAVTLGVAAATLSLAGVAAASSTAPVLSKSGPADEGPYPYAYPASGHITAGSGTTVGGTKCMPGTPQFASPYADPCIPKFTGNNGGATYRGVTSTEIVLAQRQFPSTSNSQQVAAQAEAAGVALPAVSDQVEQVFLNYFNKAFDLYGRKVVIEPMTATGNSTLEALNQDQTQACADAATIADQMHAFGEVGFAANFNGAGGTGPFSTCAADDHLVEFGGDVYYNEGAFQAENPYVWSATQNCTLISANEAEVVGTMLADKPAKYAGEPDLISKTRKFGTYVPNVPAYLTCYQ